MPGLDLLAEDEFDGVGVGAGFGVGKEGGIDCVELFC